jgi:hypothetical protein
MPQIIIDLTSAEQAELNALTTALRSEWISDATRESITVESVAHSLFIEGLMYRRRKWYAKESAQADAVDIPALQLFLRARHAA